MTHHICLYLGFISAGLAYILGYLLGRRGTLAERVVRRCQQ